MQPSVLFLITSDPRRSPKPAEAIRMAVGVGVWRKVGIRIYLRNAAVLALSENPADLIDDDIFGRYLPLAADFGHPIYVQRDGPYLAQTGQAPLAFKTIDDAALAALAAQSAYVLRF